MQTSCEIKKGTGSIEDVIRGHAAQKPEERLEEKTTGDKVLDEVMRKYERDFEQEFWSDKPSSYLRSIEDVLTPTQINAFLRATIAHEQHENYQDVTGEFVSRLIQNSYNAGHNNFFLDTQNIREINFIGYDLNGTPKKPIMITIRGSVGKCLGYDSRYCEYMLTGDTAEWCGEHSKNSTYKTNNLQTLTKMQKEVWSGNRIIFIHPDGTEQTVRDYADKR